MKRFRLVLIIIAICLPATIGVCGQVQRPMANRPADAASDLGRVLEPESPATGSTVVPSPQAVVPRLMKFSGVLNYAAGKPLSGAVDVTFALYNTEAGGEPLWFETQSVQADELGRYTALLGAMHAEGLPVDLFTSGEVRWLGIQIGSEAEQQPRVLLVSVPYALKAGDAETLGGKPASAYMLVGTQSGSDLITTTSAPDASTAPASTTGKKQKSATSNNSPATPCASLTSDGAATANSIALFTTACNIESANLVQYSGNLGFGTTTPQARLHIFGPDISDADARFNFILGDSTAATAGSGGGILFSGYYNGITSKAGFGNIRGVKENAIQGNYASAMIFDTRVNGGNQTERMRISSAGNVGIGTSAPAARLDVAGDTNVSGNISLTGTLNFPQTTGSNVGVIKIGGNSMFHACCGSSNSIFIGDGAGGNFSNTGTLNTATGVEALYSNTSGSTNTANGASALLSNTTGSNNTGVGYGALFLSTTASYNTANGSHALQSSTTGGGNTANGSQTLFVNTTGSYNTANGLSSLLSNTTGSFNTAGGYLALYENDTGNWNTAFGTCALISTFTSGGTPTTCSPPGLSAGIGNTAVGGYAGHSNTTGQGNTFIGYQADAGSTTLSNATAIGANAVVGESNAVVLGGTGGSAVNVGIGTTTPVARLQVATANDTAPITIAAWDSRHFVVGNSGSSGGIGMSYDQTNNVAYIEALTPNVAWRPLVMQLGGGSVGIGTNSPDSTLTVNGTADKPGGGSWGTFSDARLKTLDGNFPLGLEQILKLNPVIYRYKQQNALGIRDHDPHVGVVAQDVEKIIPEAVSINPQGYRIVNNDPILWAMLNAIKEQQKIIVKQQLESETLRAEIQKEHARASTQESHLELQQKQIATLESQMRIIQASLKVKSRTRSLVRLAGASAPAIPAARSLPISSPPGSSN